MVGMWRRQQLGWAFVVDDGSPPSPSPPSPSSLLQLLHVVDGGGGGLLGVLGGWAKRGKTTIIALGS